MKLTNYQTLLQQYDDSENYEFPGGYNEQLYNEAEKKIRLLAEKFQTTLDINYELDSEADIQDASFHAQITIPKNRKSNDELVCVRFSNFGNFATIYTLLGSEKQISNSKLFADLVSIIENSGFIYIPWTVLNSAYTGKCPGFKTWWGRYFDYI